MRYVTSKEIAVKWNITQRRVQYLCEQRRVEGSYKFGNNWAIPEDAKKPNDPRKAKNRLKNNMSQSDCQRLVAGTFAVEGLELSNKTIYNFDQLAKGKNTANNIVNEICSKYLR